MVAFTASYNETELTIFHVHMCSDFLVFRDCPYIQFSDLEVEVLGDGTGKRKGPIMAQAKATHVWRRSTTAARVGLSEESFVEWCILMGNDYTGTNAFNRSMFEALPDMSPVIAGIEGEEGGEGEKEGDEEEEEREGKGKAATQIHFRNCASPEYLMDLYEVIKVNDSNCRLSSRTEELQLAIEFSR